MRPWIRKPLPKNVDGPKSFLRSFSRERSLVVLQLLVTSRPEGELKILSIAFERLL